jgi:hypothetical protein
MVLGIAKRFSEKMINGEEYTQLQDFKIKPSSAGFFEIKDADIHSYGYGTFVSIGKIQGLLTCAHVLKAISGLTQISLAIFPVRPVSSLFPLNLTECDQIKFGPSYTAEGPDLGFLRLPIPFVSSVSHLVSVKSLDTGRADAFAQAEPSDESITVVAGAIDEWTSKENNNFVVRPLISIGRIDDRIQATDGHDLFYFQPVPDDDFQAPKSFKGTSGGGLWRIYPRPQDGREIAYSLMGVAFYETRERQIISHGQASLYVKLFDAIRDKWPDAR